MSPNGANVKRLRIGKILIGDDEPCLIIAEAGVNHNGRLSSALRLCDAAKKAGAQAIKFQTFIAEDLVTPGARKAAYQRRHTPGANRQLEMLKALELKTKDYQILKTHCEDQGILFLSTPFEDKSLDFLESLRLPAYKISSTDLTNTPFIGNVARKGKPILLSTGMSYFEEVAEAVRILRYYLDDRFVLLHCTSNYPTREADVNLRAMITLRDAFGCLVGYSDHTAGLEAAPLAVAMGAKVIEKHLTLDRTQPGPDHRASILPAELTQLVQAIRQVELFRGSKEKKPCASEMAMRRAAQKSIVAAEDILRGTRLTRSHLTFKRPASGLSPNHLVELIGSIASRDIRKDEPLSAAMISSPIPHKPYARKLS